MRAIGAKTAWVSGKIEGRHNPIEPRFVLWGVEEAVKSFAALDRVRGVLDHVEQFGEFRPVASAGDMRIGEPGRQQPETVQAALFFMGCLVDGALRGVRPMGLIQSEVPLG